MFYVFSSLMPSFSPNYIADYKQSSQVIKILWREYPVSAHYPQQNISLVPMHSEKSEFPHFTTWPGNKIGVH